MSIAKKIIRDRLITNSTWVTTTHTELSLVAAIVPERMLRYVVAIFINGNQQLKQGVEISTLNEGGTAGTLAQHTVKFSHINVAPADNVQLPDGDYNVEDPLFTMEGGTRGPYGRVLQAGHSVNLTVVYWDSDIKAVVWLFPEAFAKEVEKVIKKSEEAIKKAKEDMEKGEKEKK